MKLNYNIDFNQLALEIKQFGKELGFDQIGITDTNIEHEASYFKKWLASGHHGSMRYFEKHGELYEQPQKLMPTAIRIICCSISYPKTKHHNHPIASFAQFQDYSNHIRQLLKIYADKISDLTKKTTAMRVFAGNAPILEKGLAAKAGLGWTGKNSILLHHELGSHFFLGEIFTEIPLPLDKPITNRCGDCFKCQESCPTKAIIAPYKIDARRCISYLTIEHRGSIPIELRPLIGTRIFGCDICQQACPWNEKITANKKWQRILSIPEQTNTQHLIDWFLWNKDEFKEKTKDSPIIRIGHERWLRNIAIALGNTPKTTKTMTALRSRINHPSELVHKHIEWAINKLDVES